MRLNGLPIMVSRTGRQERRGNIFSSLRVQWIGKTCPAWSPAWRPQGTFSPTAVTLCPCYDLYVDTLLYGAMLPYVCSIAHTSGLMIYCCIHTYDTEVNVSNPVKSSLYTIYLSLSQSLWMLVNQQHLVVCSLCCVARNCCSFMINGLQWPKEI